jgi:hypothetical protein
MNKKNRLFLFIPLIATPQTAMARIIPATPATFEAKVPYLLPGDNLQLAAGTYRAPLTINQLNGTASYPIMITGAGDATIFKGNDCCNTISLRKSSYIVIKNIKLDGLNIKGPDGIKAEGNTASNPNWTHHITVENLTIVNYANNQQQVGISTKCPSSNWIIKNNTIDGAGTGMYLGNSDGTQPFVNGIIENNFIQNTIGYNIEIKHQFNGKRDLPEGVKAGTNQSGKTIIRNNVFSKGKNSSTGEKNARPNLLVGGFPSEGTGKDDYYEVYGNFFYNNPVEALFQGTGNIMLYSNIFVNHTNPSGHRTVYIKPHNGVSPQKVKIFHNTLWSNTTAGGIRIDNPDVNYQQYVFGNAAFLPDKSTAITASHNNTLLSDNIIDSYANADNYVMSPTIDLNVLNLYPKEGRLKGNLIIDHRLFISNTAYDKDFNKDVYDWTYRGAYSGSGFNKGWKLTLAIKKH